MDPWLERPGLFPDLHAALIGYLRESLNSVLPDGYAALGTSLVWTDENQRRIPDVGLFGPVERSDDEDTTDLFSNLGMVAVLAEPLNEPWTEPYLEIRSNDDERIVTAIEVLSPSNKKAGDAGRAAYLQKQGELRRAGVHLVEIDLLRGGEHSTAIPLRQLERVGARRDYHVCVTVVADRDRYEVKTFQLADRLPNIAVPLDPGVQPVVLDLQPILDRAYDTGRYARFAKYETVSPFPPLSAEHVAWAEGILKSKGVLK
jgi:hypothetical protein